MSRGGWGWQPPWWAYLRENIVFYWRSGATRPFTLHTAALSSCLVPSLALWLGYKVTKRSWATFCPVNHKRNEENLVTSAVDMHLPLVSFPEHLLFAPINFCQQLPCFLFVLLFFCSGLVSLSPNLILLKLVSRGGGGVRKKLLDSILWATWSVIYMDGGAIVRNRLGNEMLYRFISSSFMTCPFNLIF